MMNLFGFYKQPRKDVKITIEYCPRNVTLPYKVKKLINQASIKLSNINNNNSTDPFGFQDTEVRVGEFMNESQLKSLVEQAQSGVLNIDSIEIIEGTSSAEELLHG
jgi:hypothetical protein